MSKKKFSGISGKGYYIALILCAAAIGISGYLYYQNEQQQTPQLQAPTNDATGVVNQTDSNVEAVATQGGEEPPQTTVSNPQKPSKVTKPVSGETIADYSMDALVYNQTTRDWRVHDGADIAAAAGTAVCAAADGTVYTVYEDDTMGMTVVIRHEGGYTTKYASLAKEVSVKAGDTVTAGQTIGTVGATALMESAIGDHVHFSVSCNGEPVNPKEFLG
ncbi:MAG: peptidoglycan DD-metalloendopeptidase family protein [Oscillospiraceae bacterium]|nr:peptidoglycan DD-metalloendopeptidase family protein [Oscillospiraceae bacterium]